MEDGGSSRFLILLCVVLSAFFSATETAFNSVNRIRMKNLAEKGDKKAELVLQLLEQYDKLLSTILIGNNLVNIAATSMATVIFVRLLGEERGSGVATLAVTIGLLIFGEFTPKGLAAQFPERFSKFSAPVMRVLMIIMTPFTTLFSIWKRLLSRLIHSEEDRSITEEELLTMVDVAEDEGGIDEQESALLRNSIDFMDQEAQDILTPRVDIVGVERGEDKQEIARRFAETGYSRLPVYEGDLDHIVGILSQKDFYNKAYDGPVAIGDIIRPVIFVSEHRNLGNLLREMQQKKMQIAVVLDEFGGTRGIVTMEDILEELVGEIWDEHDEIVNEIEETATGEYLVLGGTNLEKLMDELECTIDSDALTVSGWVLEAAGHIPMQGEELEHDGFHITVLEMEERRVKRIRLVLPQEEASR